MKDNIMLITLLTIMIMAMEVHMKEMNEHNNLRITEKGVKIGMKTTNNQNSNKAREKKEDNKGDNK